MARSGYEAAKLLISKGYEVIINDINTEQNIEQMKELQSLGISIVLGSHPDDLIDNTLEMIIKNPGISNSHKYIEKARKLNIPVINELELAFRYFPPGVTIIGVTGTNGKTTTTTIIYEILKKASMSVFLMGNIGYPVCSFVSQLKDNDIAVMEVSDHQLCNVLDFKTNISILTNISEAHLDFHGSYDIYKSMKRRIFNHHTKSNTAILNLDDKEVLNLTNNIESTQNYFSYSSLNKLGCTIDDGFIYYNKEQICVLCAMDRTGNLITELICKGRMKHTDLERLFRDRIEDESILCTDSHKSYIKFAQSLGVELQQIKRGKYKEGIYHIQHINAFHSKLKKWMDRFNGVATKYLANYMYWFKWLEIFNAEKDTIKSKNLLVQSHTFHIDTKLKDFRVREAIYV